MQELKNELMNYLPKLINGINTVAIHFHANKLDKGLQLLGEVVEGIDWVSQVYSSLSTNSTIDLSSLNSVLDQFNNSLLNKDYLASGDILEYEVSPVLENIYHQLNREILNN